MKNIKLAPFFLIATMAQAYAQDTLSVVPIQVEKIQTETTLSLTPVLGVVNISRAVRAFANKTPMLLFEAGSSKKNCPQIREGEVPLKTSGYTRTAQINDILVAWVSRKTLNGATCLIYIP